VSADDRGSPAESELDLQRLYEGVERTILGSGRTLNRVQVAEQAGVPLDRAMDLWRALGFPSSSGDDEVLFGDADVEALKRVSWLVDSGFVEAQSELTLVRSVGRSFARLADWEVTELTASALSDDSNPDAQAMEELVARLLPVVEEVHAYVWRRHVANAAGRMLLSPGDDDNGVRMVVGFADIVGFTRRSRGLSRRDLARLVEVFEATAASVVTEHRGRVIKTIGDEVLFTVDDPADAGRIALRLAESHHEDEDFPEVRIGLAYGDVLSRLGDVYGPVVNIASRLTTLARPGRVLVDRELRDALEQHEGEFHLRRGRTATVRGYSRLELWGLRRPKSKGKG
jgi:adenylate cyclase